MKTGLFVVGTTTGILTIAVCAFFKNHWGLGRTFVVPSRYKEISLDDDNDEIDDQEKQRRKDIAESCIAIYHCIDGIKPTDEIYERFSKNIRMEDAQFIMDGIDELRTGFDKCAKVGRSKLTNFRIKHYDRAVFIKFDAHWKFFNKSWAQTKWPEWLFVQIVKEKNPKTNKMQLYAKDIYDIWHGVHLLWLFGLTYPVKRLQFALINSL